MEQDLNQTLDIVTKLGVRQLLTALLILFVGLLLVRLVMKLVDKSIVRLRAINPALHSMLKTAVRFALNLIVILTAASSVGIPITSFVALLSVVSLAISLAVQGVLNNLAGGVIILVSKPFTLGDFISADSVEGVVKEIGFLHTRLLTADGKQIFVPNNLLYTTRIINHTANVKRRVDVEVSACYDASPDQVRAACLAALEGVPGVLTDPAAVVSLLSYGDNAINYCLRYWANWEDYYATRGVVIERLYTTFKQHGVEMTYPHVNVHMVSK